jgi:hypothetical protein
MSKRSIGLVTATSFLAACGANQERPSDLRPSAAQFTYFSPATKVKLVGDFILSSCDERGVQVSSTLDLVTSGAANTAAPLRLDAAELRSARQKRELAIELHDNRTIKSLNASSSDRTGAIITNVLKAVTSIAGVVTGAGMLRDDSAPNDTHCNLGTLKALNLAANLRQRIANQRTAMVGASAADAEKIGLQIDALAKQLALVTTSMLTISVSKPVPLGDQPGTGVIRWTISDLGKWFLEDPDSSQTSGTVCRAIKAEDFVARSGAAACSAETSILAIGYSVTAASVADVADRVAASRCAGANAPRECGRTIVLASPVAAKVEFTSLSDSIIGHSSGDVLGSQAITVPQWGPATYLPLGVGLFQSRTIGFTFDQFGNRQSFKWSSEATAENATSAIVSAAEAGASAIKKAEGPTDAAEWKAQADELEARMRLNKLKLCEEAIRNGATKCE